MVTTAANFNEEFKKALELNKPTFELSDNLRAKMVMALSFTSPIALGMSGQEMADLYNDLREDKELNYYQYACASNTLEARTSNELGICMASYLELMLEVNTNTAKWNAETEEIRQVVLQTLAKNQLKPGLKSV